MRSTNTRIIAKAPTNPSSSQTIENTKSLCDSGRYKYFCLEFPNPRPKSPPEPIAISEFDVCQVSLRTSANGSCHDLNLIER